MRVVPNLYPALEPPDGLNEVVVHTPAHVTAFAALSPADVVRACEAWAARRQAHATAGWAILSLGQRRARIRRVDRPLALAAPLSSFAPAARRGPHPPVRRRVPRLRRAGSARRGRGPSRSPRRRGSTRPGRAPCPISCARRRSSTDPTASLPPSSSPSRSPPSPASTPTPWARCPGTRGCTRVRSTRRRRPCTGTSRRSRVSGCSRASSSARDSRSAPSSRRPPRAHCATT